MLEGSGICHHFFPGDLPNVPTCKNQVSWGHKLLSAKAWQCRGAWRVASLEPNSCNCHGSPKDALTSLASFLASSFPSTADSSIHHSGVLHLSAFYGTHRPKSKIRGSRGIFLPSSSGVSSNPRRKEATISFSSGSSSKSEPLPSDPSSPGCVLGLADWLGAGSSANLTWQCLFFCPSLLSLWWSLLLDLALDWEWFLVWLSLSISSSRVATMASTFWWAYILWLDFMPWNIIPSSVGGATPRGVGASRMRLGCSFRSLVLLTFWMVWDRGHHVLKYGWLSRRGSR